MLFFGAFTGIGCGLMYFVPLICCWEYYPERKGLITGVILGSYGLGNFFFTQVATLIVNPNNKDAEIHINDDLSYFTKDIADNVP